MCERLEAVDADPGALDAILVSHAHSDHVKGVGVLSRKFKLPVFINQKTLDVAANALGKLHRTEVFRTGSLFETAGIKIHPFSVPHDCADPVGFRLSKGTVRVGIATDLGTATGLVENVLSGLRLVVLESNHDPQMLRDGPYPWELKQRVQGRRGHLSNLQSAKLLRRLVSDELETVVLAHVSETNNLPELALRCAHDTLGEFLHHRGTIHCASQDEVGPTFEL